MAAGAVCLRRLLLAAIMLSLAICLQEVTAESGGEGSEDDKGDKGGKSDKDGKDGEGSKDGEGGEDDKAGEDGEGGEDVKGGNGSKGSKDGEGGEGDKSGEHGEVGKASKGGKTRKGGQARSKTPRDDKNSTAEITPNEETDDNSLQIGEGNETDSNNSTIVPLSCPKECAEWKLEVLALCGNELKGFDNLCYFFQHKCNNPTAGCHFYCCLYPGTDIATASKFDCDDMCTF